jgi:hypothetical protein
MPDPAPVTPPDEIAAVLGEIDNKITRTALALSMSVSGQYRPEDILTAMQRLPPAKAQASEQAERIAARGNQP